MPFIPKFPEACRHLDLDHVRLTLVKHRANIPAAAKELKVSRTDLSKLTWHDPKLLEPALEMCDLFKHRCISLMIRLCTATTRKSGGGARTKSWPAHWAQGARWRPRSDPRSSRTSRRANGCCSKRPRPRLSGARVHRIVLRPSLCRDGARLFADQAGDDASLQLSVRAALVIGADQDQDFGSACRYPA
jgi:hypothetical protein